MLGIAEAEMPQEIHFSRFNTSLVSCQSSPRFLTSKRSEYFGILEGEGGCKKRGEREDSSF